MVIQLRDVEDWFVEDLKKLTGQATASKAFIHAAGSYSGHLDKIARLERDIISLNQRALVQMQLIERARDSAAALLDHVGQEDLFNAPL